jgi:hypothetical protein
MNGECFAALRADVVGTLRVAMRAHAAMRDATREAARVHLPLSRVDAFFVVL